MGSSFPDPRGVLAGIMSNCPVHPQSLPFSFLHRNYVPRTRLIHTGSLDAREISLKRVIEMGQSSAMED